MNWNISAFVIKAVNRHFQGMGQKVLPVLRLLLKPLNALDGFIKHTMASLMYPPAQREDYLQVGKLLFSKHWLFKASATLVIVVFIAYAFAFPFLEGRLWIPTITLNSNRFFTYSGSARVVDDMRRMIYIGEISEGNANGQGLQFDTEGNLVFSGSFMAGQYHGFGRMYQNSQLLYTGQFAQNLFNGIGRLYEPDDRLIYEGEFQNGLRHGNGTAFHRSTGYRAFTGSFLNGYAEGEGVSFGEDGVEILYIGSFSRGQFSGQGQLFEAGQLIYDGEFRDGLFSGEGILFCQEAGGHQYRGQFLNGLPHGTGELIDPVSLQILYYGGFANGLKHGMGTQFDRFGFVLYEGMHINGVIDYKFSVGVTADRIREMFGAHSALIPAEGYDLLVYRVHEVVFIMSERDGGAHISETILVLPSSGFLHLDGFMSQEDAQGLLGLPAFSLNYYLNAPLQAAFAALNVTEAGNRVPGDKFLMDGYYIRVHYSPLRDRIIAIEMGV